MQQHATILAQINRRPITAKRAELRTARLEALEAATLEAIGQPDWTPAEEHAYQKALEFYLENDCTDAEADEAAWQTVCEVFPRLAGQAAQPFIYPDASQPDPREALIDALSSALARTITALDYPKDPLSAGYRRLLTESRATLAAAIAHQEARR